MADTLLKHVIKILEEELNNNPQTRRKKFKYQNKEGVIHIYHFIDSDYIEIKILYDFDEKNGVFKTISPTYNFKIKKKTVLEFSNWKNYV